MASFNKVILIGNLTADPEIKQTQSGESVCSFSIAVNRRFAKNGECDFLTIVAWKKNAEFVCQWFKKGNPILICGQIQIRSWEDNQGQKRYATEVVADEVSFVASAPMKKEENNVASVPDPRQWGNGQTVTQNKIDYGASAQFEEIQDDEGLPF